MTALVSFAFGTNNSVIPKGGPKVIPVTLDFSNTGQIEIDGEQVVSSGAIEFIQGVYIDNADNASAFTITCQATRQRIKVPANSQGFFPLLCANPPKLLAATLQQPNPVTVAFYNVPIQSFQWKTQ